MIDESLNKLTKNELIDSFSKNDNKIQQETSRYTGGQESIQIILDNLASKNNVIIYDAIVKIKNLIIGNNKFKSLYLKDKLVKCLIELINNNFVINFNENLIIDTKQIELTNQIILTFASFSLGNLEHVSKLIKLYKLHELLFCILRLNAYKNLHQINQNQKLFIKLIESCLRCLSNLYVSSQLVPYLVYKLDQHLYLCSNNDNETDNSSLSSTSSNLECLFKFFGLSNFTKQTILNIITVSSHLLSTSIFYEPLDGNGKHIKKIKKTSSLSENINKFRACLIKSDVIKRFACLLTSLQTSVQLNALKFYASVSFESFESSKSILNTSYYDFSLVDLIGAYLSRENGSELQLYSAKCLANICRSCSILNINYRINMNSCITPTNNNSSNINSNFNESYYFSSGENIMDLQNQNDDKEKAANIGASVNFGLTKQVNKVEKHESLTFKPIQFNSQLIKQRTLPTLIRLCCTYSINFRTNNYSNLINTTVNNIGSGSNVNGGFQPNINLAKYLNSLLLIESISTLTYLIELSSDLQMTASYLEQIIPTLSQNIINAFSIGNLSNLLENNKNDFDDIDTLSNNILITNKSSSSSILNESKSSKKSKKRPQLKRRKLSSYSSKQSTSNKSKIGAEDRAKAKLESIKSQLQQSTTIDEQKLSESSLFSFFYLSYNQFATKGIHFKLNEHQYRIINQLYLNDNFESIEKQNVENNEKSNQYEELQAQILNKMNSFLINLDTDINKRIACVCFQALAALASNNEEARRIISENLDLTSKIVDSIQIKPNLNSALKNPDDNKNENDGFNCLDDEDEDEEEEEDEDDEDEDEEDDEEEYDQEEEDINENDNSTVELNDIEMTLDQNHDLIELNMVDDTDLDEFRIWNNDKKFENNYFKSDSNIMRMSALCLLHSLSRSVQQLRTKFLDNKLWMCIIDLIKRIRFRRLKRAQLLNIRKKSNSNKKEFIKISETKEEADIYSKNEKIDETLVTSNKKKRASMINDDDYAPPNETLLIPFDNNAIYLEGTLIEQNFTSLILAILANLLLDFSPCKDNLIENDIIKILVEFIDYKNISIQINAMWALMNLAYKANQKTKQQILSNLTIDKLFQLLTEQDETLIIKTLELIKNLLCNRIHIDQIMNSYGNKIIQAVIMILESEYYNMSIKEQALCILANVADGSSSKEFIMGNEDLLRKINSFMTNNYNELQVAAVCCISNLVNSQEDGSMERQFKLKELGAHRILQKLLHSNDAILFDKVKNALQQFSSSNLIINISNSVNILSTSGSNSSSSSSSSA